MQRSATHSGLAVIASCGALLLICVAISWSSGGGDSSLPDASSQSGRVADGESDSQSMTTQQIDFDYLLLEIENCNKKDLSYFDQRWSTLYPQLKTACDRGQLEALLLERQETLWTALAYLQGCRHPRIMHDHGDQMLEILRRFGTREQRALLD